MTTKLLLGMSFAAIAMFAADDVVTAVEGTVKKVDAGTKTVVIKTTDGTEHTVHFVSKTSVHGWDATDAGAKDGMHGVKEGSHVVVHYTVKGSDKTAQEVDRIGEGGLKVSEGTVSAIDRGSTNACRADRRWRGGDVQNLRPCRNRCGQGHGQGRAESQQGHGLLYGRRRKENRALLQEQLAAPTSQAAACATLLN